MAGASPWGGALPLVEVPLSWTAALPRGMPWATIRVRRQLGLYRISLTTRLGQ